MYSEVEQNLRALLESGADKFLQTSLIGIEKESLRVNSEGKISQTIHPQALGSALTNPSITTDYSEALIEFISPPLESIRKALGYIEDLHKFTYKRLDNELLWATSMPCIVKDESNIPIAQYGRSNLGKMKTVYREGLGHRYGKVMQLIAGIHFNYSYSDSFWQSYYQMAGESTELQEFINEKYFSLIRNLLRVGWIIPYLFGASPAVCKSFFGQSNSGLSSFDDKTYFEPYATSLRMSDIGYQNNEENEKGIKACYDNLEEYVANLKFAIETPCPEYQRVGVKKNGEYLQLNANILQIENEYYSTVRPKQITEPNEQPINALKKRGVKYIELRSLDINAFDPFGVNEKQLYFLEALMLFCLVADSPYINPDEREEIDKNEMLAALQGRDPELKLMRNGKNISLQDWALQVFEAMLPVCKALDLANATSNYTAALDHLMPRVKDPDKTPSARMIAEMRERGEGFYAFAKKMSVQHNNYFKQLALNKETGELLQHQVNESLSKLKEIEENDHLSFDEFLDNYFNPGKAKTS